MITEADLELTPTANVVAPFMEPAGVINPASTDISGDIAFLTLLNRNNFEIGKTAVELDQNRLTVASRFKGLCLKALAENDWDIAQAAKAIAQDAGKLELVEAKIREYYDNTLAELKSYPSLEQLGQEVGKKYKNMPRKFHGYILKMYEAKRKD